MMAVAASRPVCLAVDEEARESQTGVRLKASDDMLSSNERSLGIMLAYNP